VFFFLLKLELEFVDKLISKRYFTLFFSTSFFLGLQVFTRLTARNLNVASLLNAYLSHHVKQID
jgi:hypothetical protein